MAENSVNGDVSAAAKGATSRRNALKLGVAAGVGVAVWTGPLVSPVGAQAQAAPCSSGVTCVSSGWEASNQSDACNPNATISKLVNNLISAGIVNEANGTWCAAGQNISVNSTVSGFSSCKLQLFERKGGSGTPSPTGTAGVGSGSGSFTVGVPIKIKDPNSAPLQYALQVCCTPDDDISSCIIPTP